MCVKESWRPNKDCNILTPTLMAVSVVSFSFSWCSTGGPGAQLSAGLWLSLLHLISNFFGPQLNRGPRGPLRPGMAFPTTSRLQLQLSDFLSWLSYIIVQHPLNRPLNPWNSMFDRHQAEITVMQFTGHSLPVHPSVAAQWNLHLVPYYQPSSPVRFLSINGHWDVSLPLSLEWHVCRAEGQNTTLTSHYFLLLLAVLFYNLLKAYNLLVKRTVYTERVLVA